MARSSSHSNTVKYVAGAVAVVGVAFCLGYFVIGGSRPQTPPENTEVQNAIPPPAPASVKPVSTRIATTVRTQNGEYTAPGAPRIEINEDKTPSLTDTTKMQPKPQNAAKPNDPEASQEASPTPRTASVVAPSPDTATVPATDATPPGTDTTATDGTNATPQPTPGTTGDPDSEQVTGHGDSTSAQDGSGGQAQYRVQAGSFVAADNAKALADALKKRGYLTSTRAERDGDRTVYKVQIGAYRTRSAADKAAQDLQSSGYPASVSPIGQ